jgi:hypothetical protein
VDILTDRCELLQIVCLNIFPTTAAIPSASQKPCGRLGRLLGALGRVLSLLDRLLGSHEALLELLWSLGALLRPPGALLPPLGVLLGGSWGLLKPPGAHVGHFMGALEHILGQFGGVRNLTMMTC